MAGLLHLLLLLLFWLQTPTSAEKMPTKCRLEKPFRILEDYYSPGDLIVGLVTSDDDTGERFISTLRPMLKEEEIFLAFTEMLEGENCDLIMMNLFFNICVKAEVVILFEESSTMTNLVTALYDMVSYAEMSCQNVWILTSHWKFTMTGNKFEGVKTLHGALQF
ncbi:hypothetical protein E2320_022191 [Naja naja]|nr:hypothetical protein E2320_022191 [Naja naja]